MVVDASAFLAVFLNEAEKPAFLDKLLAAQQPTISSVNWFEVLLRASKLIDGVNEANQLRLTMDVQIAAVTETHVTLALEAHLQFGKGRHPAGLNLGDCFAYALATERKAPLLFKGADFAKTNIQSA